MAIGHLALASQSKNIATGSAVERVIGKRLLTDGTLQSLIAGKGDKQVGFGLGATIAARVGALIFAANTLR